MGSWWCEYDKEKSMAEKQKWSGEIEKKELSPHLQNRPHPPVPLFGAPSILLPSCPPAPISGFCMSRSRFPLSKSRPKISEKKPTPLAPSDSFLPFTLFWLP